MYLSKHQNGNYYIYYIGENGKRTKISCKTKFKSEAVKYLSEFQKKLNDKISSKTYSIPLSRFTFEFLKYSEVYHSSKTTKTFTTTFNHLKRYFGDIPVNEFNQRNIREYLEYRKSNSSVYQARKDLINLSSAFNKAKSDGYISINPCEGIKRFKIPEKQPIFYSESEYEKLIEVIDNKDLKDLVVFAANTGLRQMELFTLEWSQVNFKDKFLILNNHNHVTKSKKIRTVPLNIKSMQILNDREQSSKSDYVFTIDGKQIIQANFSKTFKKYVIKAGLNTKLNFHGLRHAFASWLVQKGVSILQVSKLLGHAEVRTTEIYSHLRTEDLRSSVELLS